MRILTAIILVSVLALCCKDQGAQQTAAQRQLSVSTDAELFAFVTATDPFGAYALFPHADSVTRGTLNGSTAHQPLVRVRMNGTAYSILQNGRFPAGGSFPNGSVMFKEIIINGRTEVYAVMYKDAGTPLAGNGWLWAEYQPSGSVLVSMTARGSGCTACHARELGPQHDFVRTFERQR